MISILFLYFLKIFTRVLYADWDKKRCLAVLQKFKIIVDISSLPQLLASSWLHKTMQLDYWPS